MNERGYISDGCMLWLVILALVGGLFFAGVVVSTIADRVSLKTMTAQRPVLERAVRAAGPNAEDVLGQATQWNADVAGKCAWAFMPVTVTDRWCELKPIPLPEQVR